MLIAVSRRLQKNRTGRKRGVRKEEGDFPASYESETGTNIAVRSPIAEKKKRK
jgi:hypothetical protein